MEKCLFVYNPQSGKGKIAKYEKYILEKLSLKYEVALVLSKYSGHIYDTILKQGENVDLLVVAGGDGTLDEAVNGICHLNKKPRLGYIPAGTVNDVARSLNIPRTIKRAVDNILNGEVFAHDVINVNDRYGIYVCCAGLFTETSYATEQKSKKKLGKVAYGLHALKKIFSTPAFNVQLSYGENKIIKKCSLIMILNSRNVAGFPINKKARLNDGLVDVVLIGNKKDIVGGVGFWGVIKLFLLGIKSKSNKNYTHLLLNEFDINTEDNTIINLDGEKICNGGFHIKMIKEGVNIIVPKKFIKNQRLNA